MGFIEFFKKIFYFIMINVERDWCDVAGPNWLIDSFN